MADHDTHDHTGIPGVASSTTVATDTIWDAADDIVKGSGANTAVRMALAQGKLGRVGGVLGYDSGTSFPGSPSSGDRYWRTDDAIEYYYDGTRWLTTQVFTVQMIPTNNSGILGGELRSSISASQTAVVRLPTPSILGGSDIWWVDHQVSFQVVTGGSALSGSHKWVGTVFGLDSASASTGTIATINIDSGSSAIWRTTNTAIGAAKVSGSLFYATTWTKTGTPGNLIFGETLSYRIIAT